jgi:CrcB protein
MNPTQLALIAVGGALGALSRYWVGTWVQTRVGNTAFPWGTFVINASGSFVLGLLATLLAIRLLNGANWRPLFTIGFIGAYTTFSTFEYETAQLGSSWQALMNLIGSVIVGYGCVWFGIRMAYVIAGLTGHAARS